MKKLTVLLKENFLFRLILSALTGVLMATAWPPSGLNFMLVFALTPLMLSFFSSPNLKAALLNSYLAFFIFSNYTMSWFPQITNEPKALILIYLAHILIPLTQSLPWLLAFWVKKRRGLIWALFSLPVFYLSYEIFHYHWDLTYTWLHLGLGFSNSNYFLKLYPFIGQEGGTFYILICNMILALLILKSENIKKQMTESSVLIVLLLIPLFLGDKSNHSDQTVDVAIYQPSAPHDLKYTNETIDENFDALKKATSVLDEGKVDLIVCPEGYFKNFHNNPVIINDINNHSVVQKLQLLSEEKKAAIITGVIVVKLYFSNVAPTVSAKYKKQGLFYDTYNAVMLVEPDGTIQWRSKIRLVPFAERVPFLKTFKSLEILHLNFAQSLGSYDYQRDPSPFRYKNMIIGPLVCYESLYPDVTSLFLDRKANIIIEFSNENWTKEVNKGQLQHDSYAKVNAMQFGRNYIRSTFKHGSAIFSNNTKALEVTVNQDNLLISEVKLIAEKTFYTRHRGFLRYVFVVGFALIVLILSMPKKIS